MVNTGQSIPLFTYLGSAQQDELTRLLERMETAMEASVPLSARRIMSHVLIELFQNVSNYYRGNSMSDPVYVELEITGGDLVLNVKSTLLPEDSEKVRDRFQSVVDLSALEAKKMSMQVAAKPIQGISPGIGLLHVRSLAGENFQYAIEEENQLYALTIQTSLKMVAKIEFEATPDTPHVILDPHKGEIIIHGKSYSQNTIGFYEPVKEWISEYKDAPGKQTTLELKFDYYNSFTFKIIVEIIQMLASSMEGRKSLAIRWFYKEGDEDMMEQGKDISELLDIKIELIAY
jgi:hypothetical protein